MADITKLELVQHSMNSIRYYLDDILKIQHQIDGRGTISYKVYKLND